MKKVYVILGLITFLQLELDGEFKAIIHNITEIRSFETYAEASEFAEQSISGKNATADSYLIPQMYSGDIVI